MRQTARVMAVRGNGHAPAHLAPRAQQFQRGVRRGQIAPRHAAGVHLQHGLAGKDALQRVQCDFAIGGVIFIKQADGFRVLADEIEMADDIRFFPAEKIRRDFIKALGGSEAIPGEDDQADMYLFAVDLLERHGYRQYEISNFARKGCESRHNLKYWRLEDYIGFGAAAHSNLGSLRYSYTRNVRQYISGVLGEKNIIDEQEELNAFNRAAEYLMLGMRTSRGISREEYTAIYNSSFDALEEMLEVFVANGWAVRGKVKNTERWRFTPSGYLVSNVLIGVLLEAQTKEKFNANPWIEEAFRARGEKIPLPMASEPFMN